MRTTALIVPFLAFTSACQGSSGSGSKADLTAPSASQAPGSSPSPVATASAAPQNQLPIVAPLGADMQKSQVCVFSSNTLVVTMARAPGAAEQLVLTIPNVQSLEGLENEHDSNQDGILLFPQETPAATVVYSEGQFGWATSFTVTEPGKQYAARCGLDIGNIRRYMATFDLDAELKCDVGEGAGDDLLAKGGASFTVGIDCTGNIVF